MTNVDVDITNIGVALFNRYFLEVVATALGVGRSDLPGTFIIDCQALDYEKYNELTLEDVEKALHGINVPKMTINEFYALLGISRVFNGKIFKDIRNRGIDIKTICEFNTCLTLHNPVWPIGIWNLNVLLERELFNVNGKRRIKGVIKNILASGFEKIMNTQYEDMEEKGVDLFLYLLDLHPFNQMNSTTCLVVAEFFMIKYCKSLIVIKPKDFNKIENLISAFHKNRDSKKIKSFLLKECICRFEPSDKYYDILAYLKGKGNCGYVFNCTASPYPTQCQIYTYEDGIKSKEKVGHFEFFNDLLILNYSNSIFEEIYRHKFKGNRNRRYFDSDEEEAMYYVEIIEALNKRIAEEGVK